MDYLITEDDHIISNVELLELYIPDDKGKIIPYGEGYHVLGLAIARIYLTDKSIIDKKFTQKRFQYPTIFLTKPSGVETVTSPFKNDAKNKKYKVLKYNKGSIVINNNVVIQDVSAVEQLFMNIIEGRMIYAGYKNLPEILNESKYMNGVDLRIPAYMEEVIISSAYRDASDVNIHARHSNSDNIIGLTSRVNTSSKAYSGFSFEDPYFMLIASSTNNEEGDTDLEKIVKGEF